LKESRPKSCVKRNMGSRKATGVHLWLEILDPTLPKRKEMGFPRVNKIYIASLAKFKEETKMRNKRKWKKPENSLQNKHMKACQYQVTNRTTRIILGKMAKTN